MAERTTPKPSAGKRPAFELVSGYTRFTLTPTMTRVSVAAIHHRHRHELAAAALMIRANLETRGSLVHRLTGAPKITANGTIRVTLIDRLGRRRYTTVITPTDIASRLRRWTHAL
jgi:hypothetical protein